MVSISSACCSHCRLKSNQFPHTHTLPSTSKSSSSACRAGLSFSGRRAPVDGWPLFVAVNHPLPPFRCPRALVDQCPTIVVTCRRATIVAVVVSRRHAFAPPIDGWLLFVVLSSPLHLLTLSYVCPLSSSACHANDDVDEAARGQSPMQPPPIFAEMEPVLHRRHLALCLALAVA